MNAPSRTTEATIGKAEGRRFWRWPLALSLALAVAISLFHDVYSERYFFELVPLSPVV
jgi:hypothetical protein